MGDKHSPKFQVLHMLCDKQQWGILGQTQFTVAHVMTSPPITMSSTAPFGDAIKLLGEKQIRHVLVTEQKKLVGIISDRDILRLLQEGEQALERPLSAAASKQPVVTTSETPLDEAASLMLTGHFSSLPVVNPTGEPVGVVTTTDLLWLLGLLQLRNSGDMPKILRGLVQEITHLMMKGHLSKAEADQLTSELLESMGDTTTLQRQNVRPPIRHTRKTFF